MNVRHKVAEEGARNGQGPDDVALVAPVRQVHQSLSQLAYLQLKVKCAYSMFFYM